MKINDEDLPNLFQITIAQEANAKSIEALHDLFERQQQEIDYMKETIGLQHEILEKLIGDRNDR